MSSMKVRKEMMELGWSSRDEYKVPEPVQNRLPLGAIVNGDKPVYTIYFERPNWHGNKTSAPVSWHFSTADIDTADSMVAEFAEYIKSQYNANATPPTPVG